MVQRPFPALVFLVCFVGTAGCDDKSEPSSQQAFKEAWKRSDQAVKQSVAAQDEVKHIARVA